jgi:hypothetical protein
MPKSEKTEAIEFVGALLTDIALLEAAIAILDRVKVEDAAEDAKHMIEMCRRRVTMMRTAYVRACNAVR